MSLELTLPGRWLEFPLQADDASAQLKRFARELAGEHDRQAPMRARLHQQLLAAHERARHGNAEQLHLGLMLTAEVPLPAAITVYPSIAVATTQETTPASVMDAFVPLLLKSEHEPRGGSPLAGRDDRVFTRPQRSVLRRARTVYAETPQPDALSIDYWQTVPRRNHVQLVHVSMADAVATELLITLFDEIVFASKFPEPGALADELRG